MRHASVRNYLLSLSRLALEVANRPALLPSFLRIIAMAPRTILGLQAAAGHVAAGQLPSDRMRCYSAPDILQ